MSLQHVHTDRILTELIALQGFWIQTHEGDPEFGWRQAKISAKRLRALLPGDPDLAENVSPGAVRSLAEFVEWIWGVYGFDQPAEVVFPEAGEKMHVPPPGDDLYRWLKSLIADFAPDQEPQPSRRIRFCDNCNATVLPEAPKLAIAETPEEEPAHHGIDFRSVRWFGRFYEFTPTQAACVRIWWEHWEQGVPSVGDGTIIEEVEIPSGRLAAVFDGNPAWGTMITPGGTKGTHRLAQPEKL